MYSKNSEGKLIYEIYSLYTQWKQTWNGMLNEWMT